MVESTGSRREAEGAGVERARLIAHPLSRQVPSPIGWPFSVEQITAWVAQWAMQVSRTARMAQYPDQDSNPKLLVRSEA